MNSDRLRFLGLAAAPLLLAGCETAYNAPPNAAQFGEPNRQTMLAQVVDPDPQYDQPANTSAEHAAQAADRYSKDKVKPPPRVRSTVGSGGGGGSGGSGGN